LVAKCVATATKLHGLGAEGVRALKELTAAFCVKKVQFLPNDDVCKAFLVRCEEELERVEGGPV
jgi:hypothetical protein